MRFSAGFGAVLQRGLAVARCGAGIGAVLVTLAMPGPASAQSAASQLLQSLSPDQVQKLQQQMGGASGSTAGSPPANTAPTVIQPAAPPTSKPTGPSRLERVMSARAGVQLRQFGYDQLGVGQAVTVPQTGAVQDSYVLGIGDEIDVTLRGQENAQYQLYVDRNGQVALPKLPPISAAGRTLADFRADLLAAIHRSYVSTEGYVSVGQVRQVSVYVTGEVANPGTRILTGLSSPVDAILISGGIKRSGSLRNVKLIRNGHTTTLDLYAYLTQSGGMKNMLLADGDRIVVPPLGPTVSVAGWVRQPAIYELPAGSSAISVRGLLSLAGGLVVRGRYRLSLLKLNRDGRSALTPTTKAGTVHDSEVLYVQPAADQSTSKATLSGGSALAGRYAVGHKTMLSEIIKAPGALGDSPYTLIGFVSRRDPKTYLRELVAFSPVSILNGSSDMALRSDDIVRVLSVDESVMVRKTMDLYRQHQKALEEAARNPESSVGDVSDIFNAVSGKLQSNGKSAPSSANASLAGTASGSTPAELAALGAAQSSTASAAANDQVVQQLASKRVATSATGEQQSVASQNLQPEDVQDGAVATNQSVVTFGQLAGQLGVSPTVLANFVLGHSITIGGAVRGPGSYPVGPGVSLKDVVQAAGGTLNWADESGVELTTTKVDRATGKAVTRRISLPLHKGMLADYIVQPRDEIRFREVYTDVDAGTVTLQGQVRFPGSYQISRGEHLSDLLVRAGGLTDVAFPYGTVFLRRSAAAQEAAGYKRAADEINNQLLVAMTRTSSSDSNASGMSPQTFAALQGFVNELRHTTPLGRVSVTADPSVLLAHPSLDVLLEPSDVIYIPQRPSTVAVLGRVLQPGSFPFRPGASVEDYVDLAGGYAQFASESETFVVLPDGTARKIESSWLNFDQPSIPPGSAVVVPRDLTPLDLERFLVDATKIVGQVAVSAASLAVISRQ